METTSGNLKIRDISDLTLNTALTGYGGTTTALANGRSEFVGISADELVFEGRLDDVRNAVERIEHTGTAGTISLTHSLGGTNELFITHLMVIFIKKLQEILNILKRFQELSEQIR